MQPEDDDYPDDLDPALGHPRPAVGLEGLCSPTLKNKILPWLAAVRDSDSASSLSGLRMGQAHSAGAGPSPSILKKTPSRSTHSAPVFSRARPVADAPSSMTSPPPEPAVLGSPIKMPSLPRTPSSRKLSASTGARDDQKLLDDGTVVSGKQSPVSAGRDLTPPSRTIPSAFGMPSSGSPLPTISSALADQDILRSQAQIRTRSGSRAPNIVQASDSASTDTDTSFGAPYRFSTTISHPLPGPKQSHVEHTVPKTIQNDMHAASTTGRVGARERTSSGPFGLWESPSEVKTTRAPLDSPLLAHVASVAAREPAIKCTGPPTKPPTVDSSSAKPSPGKDHLSTPTITPPSRHASSPSRTRSSARVPFDWKASMFQDRVLCELLEFLGRPGLEEQTRAMLMDLLAQRMSSLHAARPGKTRQSSSPSTTPAEIEAVPPTWAADLQKEVALLRQELREKDAVAGQQEPPSTSPTDGDSFFAGPGGLLFQQNRPLAFFGRSPFDSIGAASGHAPAQASLSVSFPQATTPARFEEIQSTTAESASPSPKIDLREPSTTRISRQTHPAQAELHVAACSTSDVVSAVTAATSPPPPVSTAAQQGFRELIERSLPPTPAPESGSLWDAQPVPAAAFAPTSTAARSRQPRPPTVTSTVFEDPTFPSLPDPRPWDLVTQRLYAWAILWEEASFTRTLEDMSLDKQVNSFALTIWTTVIFKRQLRNKICADARQPVDKMFVPPSFADLLNKTVQHQNHQAAQELLTGLWSPFHLERLSEGGVPRVIVALARHRNDDDAWAVHRFDLASSVMTTWLFSTNEQRLKDERPSRWWRAIRSAWPSANVLQPDDVHQKVHHVVLAEKDRTNVSLAAVNCFRNVLLGWRWDREADLPKLRELIWQEIRRLLKHKAEGSLVFDPATDAGRMGMDDL